MTIQNIKNINSNIKIIDNFLNQSYFNELQFLFLSNNFPWYYHDGANEPHDKHYMFTHPFYLVNTPRSNYFNYLDHVIKELDVYSILKIKANLYTRTEKNIEHGFHIDSLDLKDHHFCKTSILYLNTNNGYTKFEDGTIVKSVENKLVTFDSRLKHTGSTCTDEKIRVVLNFNYF